MSIHVLRNRRGDCAPGFDTWRKTVAREVARRNLGPRLRAFTHADPILVSQAMGERGQPALDRGERDRGAWIRGASGTRKHTEQGIRERATAGLRDWTSPEQVPVAPCRGQGATDRRSVPHRRHPSELVPHQPVTRPSSARTALGPDLGAPAPASPDGATTDRGTADRGTIDLASLDLTALETYARFAIEPYRMRMSSVIEAELHSRGTLLMRDGHVRALDDLGSHTYWAGSMLEARSPTSRQVQLRGSGLVLLPSLFCFSHHVLLVGAEERPTLIYPVGQGPAEAEPAGSGTHKRDLAALLGSTRATALEAISESCSTTELARRLHTSLATASQHAAILRGTGLVATARLGRQVRHTLTPLGHRLLQGTVTAEGVRPS